MRLCHGILYNGNAYLQFVREYMVCKAGRYLLRSSLDYSNISIIKEARRKGGAETIKQLEIKK